VTCKQPRHNTNDNHEREMMTMQKKWRSCERGIITMWKRQSMDGSMREKWKSYLGYLAKVLT
jgi:hypothetical protein